MAAGAGFDRRSKVLAKLRAVRRVVEPTVVSHLDTAVQESLRSYLRLFAEGSSVAIVAPERIDAVLAEPWLAGWYVTDFRDRCEVAAQTRGRARDELIFETSGTAGRPKMVRYRASAIRACATRIAGALALSRERTYVSLVNPRLAYGLSILHSHAVAGVPVHVRPAPITERDWASLRELLSPKTSLYLTPAHSLLVSQHATSGADGAIELIFAGGALTQVMVDRMRAHFPTAVVVNMYGQSELGPRVSVGRAPIDAFTEGDVGRPLPGVGVRIEGAESASGDGPILVRSPFRMSGYVSMDGSTLRDGSEGAEGWWPSGDVGSLGVDGRLHVIGRAAEDVNFLGVRVSLRELRTVVRAVPGVVDARVSAEDHRVFGQRPSIRVLVAGSHDGMENSVRIALKRALGDSAGAVRISIIDSGSVPDSGKL